MNDEQYLEHNKRLLAEFATELKAQCSSLPPDDPLMELCSGFGELATELGSHYESGPALIHRLFATYPELAPLLPRELLWFFGGECLHLMPDAEIEQFQQLEEARLDAASRGELFNLRDARAKLMKLQ